MRLVSVRTNASLTQQRQLEAAACQWCHYHNTLLTEISPYVVCFATLESGGESQGDWAQLDSRFALVDFNPKRTVNYAPQKIVFLADLLR